MSFYDTFTFTVEIYQIDLKLTRTEILFNIKIEVYFTLIPVCNFQK